MADHVVAELTSMGWSQDRVVTALRLRGGDQNRAVEWLLQQGPSFAPSGSSGARRGAPDPSAIEALEGFGFTHAQATAALRVSSNIEFAASWILDHPEAGVDDTGHEAEDLAAGDETVDNAPAASTEASMIAAAASYGRELAVAAGHVLQNGEGFCPLCRMEIGSELAGTGRCEACQLCSGCLAAGVVGRCPSLANGGVLHQHPLLYSRHDRLGCSVRGENCLHPLTAWHCAMGCRFAVCAVCIARTEVPGLRRHGRQGKGKGKGKGKAVDMEEATDLPAFDAAVAERIAAQGWQLRAVAEEGAELRMEGAVDVVLGSGAIGLADDVPESSDVSAPAPQPAGPLERNLSQRSRAALNGFKGHGGPALRAVRAAMEGSLNEDDERAVANVTAAEDILLHGAAVALKSAEHDQLCAAVAAGDLGLAGQFIMGASLCDAVSPGTRYSGGDDPSWSALCPVCADPVRGAGKRGGAVGCLNGHAIHAACAADLVLGGGVCPTCRDPLYFATVPSGEVKAARIMAKELSKEMDQAQIQNQTAEAYEFHVGDVVRVHAEAKRCEEMQSLPGIGGWHVDMEAACGTEGEVVEVVVVASPDLSEDPTGSEVGRPLKLLEVCTDSLDTWRWHPELLTLVRARADLADKERAAARESMEQLARLRAELATVKRARVVVGAEIAAALGMNPSEALDTADPQLILPPVLQRKLTSGSVQAVGQLGTTIAPVDIQRARHLLALARQWGDSKEAQEARMLLHGAVRSGDIDSVARTVRRYNAHECMQRLEWKDAAEKTAEYRVAPGVRIELHGRPHRGAARTGYILSPGVEFHSVREVADAEGNQWLRVGSTHAIAHEALKASTAEGTTAITEGDALIRVRVKLEDFPHAVGARVVRGPDWQFENEDGGEGCMGILLGLYPAARGWARVRWDNGSRAESYHRVGAESCFDLAFVGPAPIAPLSAQGWVQVRPGGPGTSPVVARVRGAVRCFDCGGELAAPFSMACSGSTSNTSISHTRRSAFTPVAASDLRVGDVILVAATFERVVVVEVLLPCASAHGPSLQPELGLAEGLPPVSAMSDATMSQAMASSLAVVEPSADALSAASGPDPVASSGFESGIVSEAVCKAEAAVGPPLPSLIVCRFLDEADDGSVVTAADDGVVFRAADLVWPASGPGKNDVHEELRQYRGELRSRRELVLMLGSAEVARQCWEEARAPDDVPMTFASCVRGHLLHARCFQGRLLAGRGCPVCTEALFVPQVQRTRRDGEGDCCGASDDSAAVQALGEAQAAELAAAEQATAVPSTDHSTDAPVVVESMRGGRLQMKMCPVCCSGPLLNENCSDLRAHHGQCPGCQAHPHSAAAIAEALVKNSSLSVGERIPRCGNCNMAVTFNGCQDCGHLFCDIDYENLPTWDPSAKGCLEVSIRHRRAARLLAEQVRYEAALLAHERAALEEACGSGDLLCMECKIEPPPPPAPLPPRCGVKCQRRHRGPCLVCDADARQHEGHFCPDGRRGSWLLVGNDAAEDSQLDEPYDEGEEEEEE